MSTTYYINGTNFSTATAVYTDAELTTCAPDGYYRLGNITRQQLNCQLLQEQNCNDCSVVACDTEVSQPFVSGSIRRSHQVFFDGGTAVGAMVVVVKLLVPDGDTRQIPIGLRVNYGGNDFNSVVRKVGDSAVTANSDAEVNDAGWARINQVVNSPYLILGSNRNCLANQTNDFVIYLWDGNSFSSQGFDTAVQIVDDNRAQNAPGGSPNGPEYVVLVVPKIDANVSNILVDIIQDCDAGFDLYVHCPTVLSPTNTLYSSNGNFGSPTKEDACASTDALTINFYAVGSGTGLNSNTSLTTLNPTQPQLRDVLFTNSSGSIQVPSPFDGWYRVDTGNPSTAYAIRLEDGIVAEISSCTA